MRRALLCIFVTTTIFSGIVSAAGDGGGMYKLPSDPRLSGTQGENGVWSSDNVMYPNYKTDVYMIYDTIENEANERNNADQELENGINNERVERQNADKSEANARVEGDRRTLKSANDYTDSKFGQLRSEIGETRDEARAGVAGALAASQIPQVSQGRSFSFGAGVGAYRGESAVAVGASVRFNQRTVSKMALTSDTQNGWGLGAGMAYEW